jgi:hypothetical protein
MIKIQSMGIGKRRGITMDAMEGWLLGTMKYAMDE